ncbi:uncharacterized protein LOC120837616 [Ixodes scapularis]|uniref:uncharacterized protein LOC120837616 n=1 Tax=Ixodes scapularis TaxID=6945 RepID=UPI001A9D97DB|nr:uncharacterized protein LOC120837616 [Ixodes scapularis]
MSEVFQKIMASVFTHLHLERNATGNKGYEVFFVFEVMYASVYHLFLLCYLCASLPACLPERHTKFNDSVLHEKNGNGDLIAEWCKKSAKESDGFCIICSTPVNCSQHGISAIKRHASSKKHVSHASKLRNSEGRLRKSGLVQSSLDFSRYEATVSLESSTVKAETVFALSVVASSLPYTWGDTATAIYPHMFPDSEIARNFRCGRKKLSYVISDGLGPYFKSKVIEELVRPNVFYAVMIDETPKPEEKVQQLDVLVRFYSDTAGRVVVEHLQSFNLGHATADTLFLCVKEALLELPNRNLLCLFTDGPNVMKSLKRKVKEDLSPHMLEMSECTLHKVHNAFAAGLHSFSSDLESIVADVHHYFKFAARNADMKQVQKKLGLPVLEFLRHVNSRWLTLLPGLERLLDQFEALQEFFSRNKPVRAAALTRHERLAAAFSDKALRAKLLFVKNAAELFQKFETLFQSQEPLLHILYEEMVLLVKQVLGRFIRQESFSTLTGTQLKTLDVHSSALWKERPEVGLDTEKALNSWTASEKKSLYIGARAFYIACVDYLLSRLPLDNKILFHLKFLKANHDSSTVSVRYIACQLPQVIPAGDVSALTDEWNALACETCDWNLTEDLNTYWNKVFSLKKAGSNECKYEKLVRLVKAVLSLPHGNADCERGFSENKYALQHRSSMSITSVSSLRQTKTYLRRYEGDATKVELTRPLLKCVRDARKRCMERVEKEQESLKSAKRRRENEPHEKNERMKLEEEKSHLLSRMSSMKSLLSSAQELINLGVKNKDLGKVESGNILLDEANTGLPKVLKRIEQIDAILMKPK